MIALRAASLVYSDHGKPVYACRQIDFDVEDGEYVGILGPSGSGKSSLLYLMSGLKTPTEGAVMYGNDRLDAMSEYRRAKLRLRDFGFVFQYPYLIGYLNALENVLVGTPGARAAEAKKILEALGLGPKMHRHPHELSGGERQRVCVARALLGGRRAIFADEPTAALDHQNGLQVVSLLSEFRGAGSLVMVTHDPSMLLGADRIVTIEEGQLRDESRDRDPTSRLSHGT